jgi:hypothetical protein
MQLSGIDQAIVARLLFSVNLLDNQHYFDRLLVHVVTGTLQRLYQLVFCG